MIGCGWGGMFNYLASTHWLIDCALAHKSIVEKNIQTLKHAIILSIVGKGQLDITLPRLLLAFIWPTVCI